MAVTSVAGACQPWQGAAVRAGHRARGRARRARARGRPSTTCAVGAPDLEVIRLYAGAYEPRRAAAARQPVAVRRRQGDRRRATSTRPTDELQADLLPLPRGAAGPDVTLVVAHKGGMRGKKVLDTLKKARARVIECPAIKTDRDKTDFVANEFRRPGPQGHPARRCAPSSRRVGKDVRELAVGLPAARRRHRRAWSTTQVVERYHGGKVEATGFRVADAAVAGDTRARRCGCCGTPSRTGRRPGPDRRRPRLASCASWSRSAPPAAGGSADLAKSLGMAPWQVDKARRPLGRLDRRRARPGHPGRRRRRLRGQGRRPRPGLRRRARRPHHHRRPARSAETFWRPDALRW